MRLSRLSQLYCIDQMVYFEGKIYERLYSTNRRTPKGAGPKHKYRVVLHWDDYDYVVEPALRKRLDRLWKRLDKEI